MPKSKYAPALFEVIASRQEAKTSGKLQIPKWWKSNKAEQPAAPQATSDEMAVAASEAAPPATDSAPAEDYSSAPDAADVQRSAPVTTAQPRFWWRQHSAEASETEVTPVVQGRAGRLVLSLTPVHATIACGAILLGLFTCFEIGRYTGRSAAPAAVAAVPDDLEKALQQPPNPSVLNVRPSAPTANRQPTRASANDAKHAPARPTEPTAKSVAATAKPTPEPSAALAAVTPAAAAEPARRSGPLTYVVLETFSAEDRSAADFAQKWLEGKGLATRVEQKGARWRLISVDGFDCTQSADDQRCTQYCEQVKTLGKACSTELRRAKLSIYNLSKPLKVRSE